MRPRTSLGNWALSKICLAVSPSISGQQFGSLKLMDEVIPESMPFWEPDSSKREEYCETLSGDNGGTLMGPPLPCACKGAVLGGGPTRGAMPSNLGSGPPAILRVSQDHAIPF